MKDKDKGIKKKKNITNKKENYFHRRILECHKWRKKIKYSIYVLYGNILHLLLDETLHL